MSITCGPRNKHTFSSKEDLLCLSLAREHFARAARWKVSYCTLLCTHYSVRVPLPMKIEIAPMWVSTLQLMLDRRYCSSHSYIHRRILGVMALSTPVHTRRIQLVLHFSLLYTQTCLDTFSMLRHCVVSAFCRLRVMVQLLDTYLDRLCILSTDSDSAAVRRSP